jgi:hypothetical protein
MEDVLSWFPGYYITITETGTKLFWAVVLNWFAVGVLHVMPSLDLDEKKKITRKVNNISWLTSARNRRGKTSRATKTDLIQTNHKITDWAIKFLEATRLIAGLTQSWQPRLCMVIESKPAHDWGTVRQPTRLSGFVSGYQVMSLGRGSCMSQSMAQILVYMAKALMMDGCKMGLVVAGQQYHFFWWDLETNRLYWVVEKDSWEHGDTLSVQEATEGSMGPSTDEWDVGGEVPVDRRNQSRRNLYRIFAHLEEQTMRKIHDQCRGIDSLSTESPRSLEGAKYVEIENV